MKIVFLGSGPFALPTLERLASSPGGHSLVRVVTRPDRPQRRGRQLIATPVRARAVELGLPCDAPESANDPAYLAGLAALEADLFIVADYGEMLRKAFRETPRLGAFNLHGSLLPRWRGAAPVAHAILAGDTLSGVTLFRLEKGLDSGPILAAGSLEILEDETAGELEGRLALLAADLLERSLAVLSAGSFRETPQPELGVTLAPKLEKSSGDLDWSRSAAELCLRVRAFNPWPGAYSRIKEERTIFLRAKPVESADSLDLPVGAVESVGREAFRIRCGSGAMEVLALQREGKAPLDAASYLRGRRLQVGDQFLPAGPATPP